MKKWNVECITDGKKWFDGETPSCHVSMFVDDEYVEADSAKEAIALVIDWVISETHYNGGKAEVVNEDLLIVKTVVEDDEPQYLHDWSAKEVR